MSPLLIQRGLNSGVFSGTQPCYLLISFKAEYAQKEIQFFSYLMNLFFFFNSLYGLADNIEFLSWFSHKLGMMSYVCLLFLFPLYFFLSFLCMLPGFMS